MYYMQLKNATKTQKIKKDENMTENKALHFT